MKRNGRSASAFPQPLQRHETDDIKEEPTMIVHPEPSAIIPDRRIYERRESGLRSSARSMPRQFVRAQGVWRHDSNGGSEERRVGKACVSRSRSRWAPDHETKNKKTNKR